MNHGDDNQHTELPIADKTLLAVVLTVIRGGEHRVGEDDFGFLKTDAVFGAVGPVLSLAPMNVVCHPPPSTRCGKYEKAYADCGTS